MRKFLFGLFILGISCSLVYSQTDMVGAGRALSFDGVDDYVRYGDVYHDVNLPFTVSAWVYIDPSGGVSPIFCTNDNPTVYKGFIFFVSPTVLACEFGDGTGGNNPLYRRGKIAQVQNTLGRWIHVCAVMTAPFNIQLYINGVDVGGDSSGSSYLPMASSIPGDIAKSAYYISNSSTYRLKGMIDEVRLWKRSLTQDEVRQQMCVRLKGNEPGLIGYWNFDETSGNTVFDKSPNGFNGTLMNNVQRVYSSAPIGDFSTYQYSSNFTGTTVSLSNGKQKLDVSDISGVPEGVQIYSVNSLPSQQGGLDVTQVSPLYFGVFMASLDANNTFTASLSTDNTICSSFRRTSNSIASWTTASASITGLLQQQEIIFNMVGANVPKPNLGPDISACDASQYFLDSHVDATKYSIKWNTGATSQGITVNQSGLYWVEVQGGCKNLRDSINVIFNISPPSFSLGDDVSICGSTSFVLDSHLDPSVYKLDWSNGAHSKAIEVSQSGVYWLEVEGCKNKYDSIRITFFSSPPAFSLGEDQTVCILEPLLLKPFDNPAGFTFTWQDGSLQSSYQVKDYGVYWVRVENKCGVMTDTLRLTKPELNVSRVPNVITPNGDSFNDFFVVQDDLVGQLNFQVFNRWGEAVFQSSNYNNNWDGNGLANGVYYAILSASCIGVYKTPLTIIR
jgi:hypothetical protein